MLGKPITPKEIHEQIAKLKTKKARGMESILSEMIKHGRYYLLPSLEKIFNDILNNGKFPTDWNIGVIKPIYKKKGDRRSPANYRGITLTSCLGKLFTSILQSRLNKYIEVHNIFNPEQFGFRRQMPEQHTVYSSCNNSITSTLNNIRSFMLVLLTMKKFLIVCGSLE